MNKNKDSKLGDKIVLTGLALLIFLGLLSATSCKNSEKFKYDKPKFNICSFFERCK